jgi:hypothetical protein
MAKIMLVIGMLNDWEEYMPDLIRRARVSHSSVHILELSAPLGTGLLTSNKPPTDESYPPASSAAVLPMDEQHFDPAEMPEDTAEAALETTVFLESVADFLRRDGLTVTTAWLPMLDHDKLGEYAHSQSAQTVALIRRGWWATLLGGDDRPGLLRDGLDVVYLERTNPDEPPERAKAAVALVGGELSGS